MSNIKCVIFDLDYTLLNHYTYRLYDDVVEILSELKSNGYKVALASYNAYAKNVLKEFDIYDYFDYIEYEDVRYSNWNNIDNKRSMLERLIKKLNVEAQEILFIDDQRQNINVASDLGINVCLVNRISGISKDKMKVPIIFKRPQNEQHCFM